jgi:hypothetical protein
MRGVICDFTFLALGTERSTCGEYEDLNLTVMKAGVFDA